LVIANSFMETCGERTEPALVELECCKPHTVTTGLDQQLFRLAEQCRISSQRGEPSRSATVALSDREYSRAAKVTSLLELANAHAKALLDERFERLR
jgi:hypothetical protein